MGTDHTPLIAQLRERLVPVDPHDTLAEAGRKVLLADFIRMLEHEAGSRSGDDIEDVHDMRVATRRMRSALRLLKAAFKPSAVYPFRRRLGKIADALGTIRDLDVLIDDMKRHQLTLDAGQQAALQGAIDVLDQRRSAARQDFIAIVDGKAYQGFVKTFAEFLTSPGLGAKVPKGNGVAPHEVRHLLPGIIHQRLAVVRAYDTVLNAADLATLHALRIEFKRLRYAVAFFTDVLGAPIHDFIEELKAIQDHLGRINDITTAAKNLANVPDEAQNGVLREYIAGLEAEQEKLRETFPEVWERFNSRAVQRKVSDALLVLR